MPSIIYIFRIGDPIQNFIFLISTFSEMFSMFKHTQNTHLTMDYTVKHFSIVNFSAFFWEEKRKKKEKHSVAKFQQF